MKKKYYRTFIWKGKIQQVECKEHSYAWSGKMPCTGIQYCIFCGKPKEV